MEILSIPREAPRAEPLAGCCGGLGGRSPWLSDYVFFFLTYAPEAV
jgi:hypothetical protein